MSAKTQPFPHDADTEKALLCVLLEHRGEVQSVCQHPITDNLFHLPDHCQLFDAVMDIPANVPCSLADSIAYLKTVGAINFQEHPALLTGISDGAPSLGMTGFYVEKLASLSRQRETQMLARKLQEGTLAKADRERLQTLLTNYGQTSIAIFREPRIRFFKPSELRAYEPDSDTILAGDCHVMRGEVFVIGGEPGVGKSTAATDLAICGATGLDWLGLPIHTRFRTMIVQNENGRFRLRQEYQSRGIGEEIEDYILVSEPPPFGMTLNHPEFLADIKAALDAFKPDVVIFDPWNAAAKDDRAADYGAAFDALRAMLPTGKDKPALGIVAHTKKPQQAEKRTGGSALMHLLSGSYVLTSVPRAIFIMVRGALDETDNSVVWFNPKNSNGPCSPRTAWERGPEGFKPLHDFDWKTFEDGEGGRKVIRIEHIREVLGNGQVKRSEAVKQLAEKAEVSDRACRDALSPEGKFARYLNFFGDLIALKP